LMLNPASIQPGRGSTGLTSPEWGDAGPGRRPVPSSDGTARFRERTARDHRGTANPAARAEGTAEAVTFTEVMTRTSEAFEVMAAAVLALGLVWAFFLSIRAWRRSGDGQRVYRVLRQSFGGVVLLALEVLVAADLIRTVAVAPTLTNVGVLGLIVLIRTFLSFSLEVEIDGVPPWRRLAVSGAAVAARASRSAADARGSAADEGAPVIREG
jgi:uncharacterized membrane protein